jgi:hypothetical protein
MSYESWTNNPDKLAISENIKENNSSKRPILFTQGSFSTKISRSPQTNQWKSRLNKYTGGAQRLNLKYISPQLIEEE